MMLLVLFLSVGARAQQVRDSISVAETNEGRQVWGKCMDFDKKIIYLGAYDSIAYVLTCDTTKKGKLTNAGHLYAVNANRMQVLWNRDLNMSMSSISQGTKRGMLVFSKSKTSALPYLTLMDKMTGMSVWTQNLYPVYVNDSLDLVVGLDKVGSAETYAYRLHDGELLWHKTIPMTKNIGWDGAVMVDSTHMVVMGDNINEIDMATGNMWTVKAKTGIHDTKGAMMMALANVASVAGSVGFSSPVVTFYYNLQPYTITGLTSNILHDDGNIYVSDREHLFCLGADSLQQRWKYDFQEKEASTAALMKRHGKVFMLNYGYGNSLMRGIVKCGKPFLAVFDAKSGQQEKMLPLYDKKHVMNDGLITEKGVFLAGGDKAVYLSFQDSAFVSKDWDKKHLGDLLYVCRRKFYGYHGKAPALSLIQPTAEACPMITGKGNVSVLDEKLEVKDTFEPYEMFSIRFEKEDAVCLQNQDDKTNFWFIHHDGSPLAKVKWNPWAIFKADKKAVVAYRSSIVSFTIPQ